MKWFLWHGNVFRADETLTDLMDEVDSALEEDRAARRAVHGVLKKCLHALEDFGTYIDNNASGIVNYGERYRCDERISTGFVESTINQVIAKRFVKKQQNVGHRAALIFYRRSASKRSMTTYTPPFSAGIQTSGTAARRSWPHSTPNKK